MDLKVFPCLIFACAPRRPSKFNKYIDVFSWDFMVLLQCAENLFFIAYLILPVCHGGPVFGQ